MDCLACSYPLCARDVYRVTSVVIPGGTDVPPVYTMGSPSAAYSRFLMYNALGSQWCKGGAVEIEWPIEHRFRIHFGVESGRA